MTLIKIKDLKKEYVNGEVVANVLNGVNLDINFGEITTILGASGAGKTTLLNIVSGLEETTSGDVLIELSNQNENQIPKGYTNRQNSSDLI